MMMNELETRLGKALAEKLTGFKYIKSRRLMIRKIDGGWQAITISIQRTSIQGVVKLAAHAHIRIDAIEESCAPHDIYLTAKEAKDHPTLVVNCDKLIVDKSLIHGFETDCQSINRFVDAYTNALQKDVLPWLERYSDEKHLFEGLNKNDPAKRITSDPLIRYPVLLAILARRGERSHFDQIADEFMVYCNQPHGHIHKRFAEAIIAGLRKSLYIP